MTANVRILSCTTLSPAPVRHRQNSNMISTDVIGSYSFRENVNVKSVAVTFSVSRAEVRGQEVLSSRGEDGTESKGKQRMHESSQRITAPSPAEVR